MWILEHIVVCFKNDGNKDDDNDGTDDIERTAQTYAEESMGSIYVY